MDAPAVRRREEKPLICWPSSNRQCGLAKKTGPKIITEAFQLEIAGRELNNYETTATS